MPRGGVFLSFFFFPGENVKREEYPFFFFLIFLPWLLGLLSVLLLTWLREAAQGVLGSPLW